MSKDNSPLGNRPLILHTTLALSFSKRPLAVVRTAEKLKIKLPATDHCERRFLTVDQAVAIAADWLTPA